MVERSATNRSKPPFIASQRQRIAFGIFAETYISMASSRQIRDEIMKMTIIVNSDPAQKAIYELSKKNQDLKEKNDSLSASMKEVRSTLGKNSDEYKKLTSELNQNKLSITANSREMERLRGEMDITKMTMQQLKKEAALLRTNLSNMVPGTQPAKDMQAQLDKVNARMSEVRTGANKTSTSFRGLADQFNHYSGIITAGIALFVGFGLSVQSVIDRNNKLVDAQTAVAKTVNMTKEEVDALTKSFSDFDTRTSRIDLLKIAETGGRLGVSKAEIKDFVQEVDKANVALGDGFSGGVEAVTDTLGKLKNLYRETKDLNMAAAINEIGSAMNELGANGAATEQNIGDFALRLGSLPDKLKPTIAQALALGAAFEESGLNAERSATAYSTFIRNAATNADKFAKVMNVSRQEVEAMMNKDPLEFFLKFSEGMKGMDTTNLAKTMDYLKLNDQYVIASMGAASENTDRFRASIDLSNTSLAQATSLTNEFNKVNNNTAAIFEKVQKRFLGLFTSESIANTLNFLISAFGKFIGAVEDSDGTITSFRNGLLFLIKTITLIMVTMVSYNLLTGVYNALMVTAYQRVIALTVVEKARNLVTGIATVLTTTYRAALWLLAAGYSLVTGNTVGATFAMRGFTAAIATNPIGLFITLLIATVTAMELFSKETNVAANAQKNLNQVTKEGVKNAAEEIGMLDKLYKSATNAALGKDAQRKAAEELIKLWPQLFKAGSEELIMNGKMEKSYYAVRQAIISASKAKAAQAEIDKINADYLSKEEEIKQKMQAANLKYRIGGATQSVNANSAGAVVSTISSEENKQIAKNRFKAESENLRKLYDERNKMLNPYIKYVANEEAKSSVLKGSTETAVGVGSSYTVPQEEDKDKKAADAKAKREAARLKRLEDQHQKEMDALARKGEESSALSRQIELDIADAKIEAMKEGYDKEIDQIDLEEQRKLAEIDKKMITKTELSIIQKKIDSAKGNDKILFQNLKSSWTKNNSELEELKLAQIAIFDNKRNALRVKSDQKWLSDQETAHQTEIGHLQRQQNEELASYKTVADLKAGLKGRIEEKDLAKIRTWAEGKEALTKVYQKRELELQITHLQAMVELYEGLDLGMLTPDQQEQVMKFIDEAGNKIAEFKAKISGQEQDKGNEPKKFSSNKSSSDVLGMSLEDWDLMFTNLQNGTDMMGTMVAAVGALQNAFGTYYQFVEANEKRQLQSYQLRTDSKKRTYLRQLNEGYINQETYKKLNIKAEQDLDKKKAEFALRAAKRERAMQVASIITNTAMAIMSIWAQVPKFDFGISAGVLTGIVGALGAFQLGTVLATPLPTAAGFEDGFGMDYPMEREQDGKRFNVRRKRLTSGLVDRPTHFIAGENNRVEMVIDSPTWTKYPTELKRAIYSANSRAKGFESGFNMNNESSGSNDDMMILLMGTISKMNTTLEDLRKKPLEARIEKTARNGKDSVEMNQMYLDLNNKNKHG